MPYKGKLELDKELTSEQHEKIHYFLGKTYLNRSNTDKWKWCYWYIHDNGKSIKIDKNSCFGKHEEWLHVIINTFIEPWGLTLTGCIKWVDLDTMNMGTISVTNNVIKSTNIKEEMKKLERELEQSGRYISYLEEHIKCSPDGELALAAKEHFITLLKY